MSSRATFDQLKSKLESMRGHNYLYMGNVVTIEEFEFNDNNCRVKTSRQWIERSMKEMLSLMTNDFLETEEESEMESTEIQKRVEEIVKAPKIKALEMCDTFMDALARAMVEVEKNPEYKGQAETMVAIAGKAIDNAKVQLDAVRLVNDIVRNR